MQQSNSLVTVKIQVTYHKQERKKPMELKETFQQVKAASKTLGLLTDEQRNEILQAVADAIIAETLRSLQQMQKTWRRWTRRTHSMTDCNSQSNDSRILLQT